MAERRMLSKKIVDSDAFMDMALSTQALYFHLLMRADDDGFIGNPKKIMRMIGSSDDEYKILLAKRFILQFPSGVCVIKHWLIHNWIRNDRYHETQYLEEKNLIETKENNSYTEKNKIDIPNDIPNGNRGKVRLGKVRLGKDSVETETHTKKVSFKIPTVKEIGEYCEERKNKVDPQRFFDYYQSKGWVVGRSPMKDWKASVRTWERSDITKNESSGPAIKL